MAASKSKQRKLEALERKRNQAAQQRQLDKVLATARKYTPPEFAEYKPKPRPQLREGADNFRKCKSGSVDIVTGSLGKPVELSVEQMVQLEVGDDYIRRELAAREQIKRKKKMVAPICNKAGYMYVGDAPPEIVQTLGRKV